MANNIPDKDKFKREDLAFMYNRNNPIPIDESSLFYTYEKAVNYAATSPVAYPGQVIAVVSESEDKVVIYKINIDRTLTALATSDNLDVKGTMVWAIKDPETGKLVQVDEGTEGAFQVLALTIGDSTNLVDLKIDFSEYLKSADAALTYVDWETYNKHIEEFNAFKKEYEEHIIYVSGEDYVPEAQNK